MILASASKPITPGPEPLACAGFIIMAFVISGSVHVVWLKSAVSLRFGIPLDCGLCFKGKRIFGDHKMLRGFIVMIPATGAAFFLLFIAARFVAPEFASQLWAVTPWRYAAVGLWAGFGFMAGELPNSFLKRQLAIPPGEAPSQPVGRLLFFLSDRLDSIIGMLSALSVVVSLPAWTWIYVSGFGIGIHWAFSALLFAFGVKERSA